MFCLIIGITILIICIVLLCIYCKEPPISQINSFSNIFSEKPNIIIVSCYGYGNIGDTMYGEVFRHYLHKNYNVVILSDHSRFINSNGKIVTKVPKSQWKYDHLIIGGGGLIIGDKLRNSHSLPYHINYSIKKGIPISIVSCGFQGDIPEDHNEFRNEFKDWIPVFEYSNFISLRSQKDLELGRKLLSSSKISKNHLNKIHYFRDLGYIAPHILLIDKFDKEIKNRLVIVFAGPVEMDNEILRENISKFIKKNHDNPELILMNMGARNDISKNKTYEAYDYLCKKYPSIKNNIKSHLGCGKAPDLYTENLESDLSVVSTINLIKNAKQVYSGRYHGMIFSRSLGVPCDTMGMDTNKIMWEEPVSTNNMKKVISNSYNHISGLLNELETKHKGTNINIQRKNENEIKNLCKSVDYYLGTK